jgi:hypothetical protein
MYTKINTRNKDMSTVTFSGELVKEFCKATEDDNFLHNPEEMRERGKLAIVPGMYILAIAAANAQKVFLDQNTKMEVYFGAPTSVGDEVNFGVAKRESNNELREHEIARLFTENNAIDVLCAPQQESKEDLEKQDVRYTRLLAIDEMPPEIEGYKRILAAIKQPLEVFTRLMNTGAKEFNEVLFSICYSSRALLRSAREPFTNGEREAKDLIGKLIPVYQSLELYIPRKRPRVEGSLHYTAQTEKISKNKFAFRLDCHALHGRLYQESYKIRATHEKLALRMAKNLPPLPDSAAP